MSYASLVIPWRVINSLHWFGGLAFHITVTSCGMQWVFCLVSLPVAGSRAVRSTEPFTDGAPLWQCEAIAPLGWHRPFVWGQWMLIFLTVICHWCVLDRYFRGTVFPAKAFICIWLLYPRLYAECAFYFACLLFITSMLHHPSLLSVCAMFVCACILCMVAFEPLWMCTLCFGFCLITDNILHLDVYCACYVCSALWAVE